MSYFNTREMEGDFKLRHDLVRNSIISDWKLDDRCHHYMGDNWPSRWSVSFGNNDYYISFGVSSNKYNGKFRLQFYDGRKSSFYIMERQDGDARKRIEYLSIF